LAIPFFSSQAMHAVVREEMLAMMSRVYDSQWYIAGEELIKFERAYSKFNQVNYTVGVGNGLDALTLALRALQIGPGDEVIVPSNTYIATWLAVSHVGATPVPVEPDPATCNIDPARIEEALTSRTRAIMPVHLYGQPCRMPEIMVLAKRYNLLVVEDNAQAQGAAFSGQLTGSFGIASGTSFYPTKNLGALGDAGAITTNDVALAQQLQRLRNYGSIHKNEHEILGYNSRLDELQAALLSVKLLHLPHWTAQRQQVAAWYIQHLADVEGLVLPHTAPGATHVYHLYVVRHKSRDALRKHLESAGIYSMIHYPVPPHRQQAYANLNIQPGSYPIAEELASTCLSLPMWPGLQEEHVEAIAKAICGFSNRR
jgi:dTDP-4-amino-4,6-dideoxygalactose transaminase